MYMWDSLMYASTCQHEGFSLIEFSTCEWVVSWESIGMVISKLQSVCVYVCVCVCVCLSVCCECTCMCGIVFVHVHV